MPQVAVRPLEKAQRFAELVAYGCSVKQIAEMSGVSTSSVRNYLLLLDLDEASQQRVRDGRLSVDQAAREVRAARKATETGRLQRRHAAGSITLPGRHGDHQHTAAIVDPLAAWQRQADCKGAVMEPPRHLEGPQLAALVDAAIDTCRYHCPVLTDCQVWVLGLPAELDPGGICGAMSPEVRAKAREERAKHTKQLTG